MVLSEISNRLQHADCAQTPTLHNEDPEIAAQRKAVADCVEVLKTIGNIPASSIFTNLRVADSLGQGKTDIDIIIISGWKVSSLMVRNWSGKLNHDAEQDTFTIQSSQKVIQVENPVAEAERRAALLRTFLNQSGIALTDKQVIGRLLLTNTSLQDTTPEELIFNNSSVIRDFDAYCRSYINTWFWTFADPVIPSLLSGALSYTQLTNSHIALAKLGTFDVAFLTGGRKIVGDMQSNGVVNFSRKDVEEIQIEKKSLGITGRVKAAVGFFPEVACIMWRRGGKGWWFRDKHSTILVPYNENICFSIAGETQAALIPINEVYRIILSK